MELIDPAVTDILVLYQNTRGTKVLFHSVKPDKAVELRCTEKETHTT